MAFGCEGWSLGEEGGLEEELKFGWDQPPLPHSHRTHRPACRLWFRPLDLQAEMIVGVLGGLD